MKRLIWGLWVGLQYTTAVILLLLSVPVNLLRVVGILGDLLLKPLRLAMTTIYAARREVAKDLGAYVCRCNRVLWEKPDPPIGQPEDEVQCDRCRKVVREARARARNRGP